MNSLFQLHQDNTSKMVKKQASMDNIELGIPLILAHTLPKHLLLLMAKRITRSLVMAKPIMAMLITNNNQNSCNNRHNQSGKRNTLNMGNL